MTRRPQNSTAGNCLWLSCSDRRMTVIDEIRRELGRECEAVDAIVSDVLVSSNVLLDRINGYLLSNSGKRIRPLLALLTAKACSGSVNRHAMLCAAASELIHTATLLHDDVVDESDLRRNRPTVRRMFSPGASLLTGDFWLSKAMSLLTSDKLPYGILRNYVRTIEDLSDGELFQMAKADAVDTTVADYYRIIREKTASLFVASVKSAAMASGVSEETVSRMEEYALEVGYGFQIRDDILDYHSSDETGKDSDSDILERKITLPLLCAFRNCGDGNREAYIRGLVGKIDPVAGREGNMGTVAEVRSFVFRYGGIEAAAGVIDSHVRKAVSCLEVLPESASKDCLCRAASFLCAVS